MMFGYVYITKNKINNKFYIGKKESSFYDNTYFGSGKLIKNAIKKYGIDNFDNKILYEAEDENTLNEKEKFFIKEYIMLYGKEMTYNIAEGGTGGNTFKYLSEKDKEIFINKMKIINKKRCSSEEFKKNKSNFMKKTLSDPIEREKISKRNKIAWSNPTLRKEQSDRLKNYYSNKNRDCSFNNKKMKIVFKDEIIIFDSRKDLLEYLKRTYNMNINSATLKKIIDDSINGNGYKPFHHNKLKSVIGMKIFYIDDVETNSDECN